MAEENPLVILPLVTVQPDVQSVMDDVRQNVALAEDVWISCYAQDVQSIHGKASITLSDGASREVIMEGRDGVQAKALSRYSFEVTCPSMGIQNAKLRAPRLVFGETKAQQIPKAIQAFDVSPNGALYATGYDNGSLSVSSTSASSSAVPKTGKPHVSTITNLRFFPSSGVLLASSMDMSVSVISALDLSSVPRRFKGHSRSVTDTAIIEQGKNIVSCAKDGTVRLWDVGGGKQIRMMGVESWSPVVKMASGSVPSSGSQNGVSLPTMLEAEVGTRGKVLCCALQSGRFVLLDLGSKTATFTSPAEPGLWPLHAVAYHSEKQLVATGSANGIISVYDARALGSTAVPLFKFKRNNACIEDMTFAWPAPETDPSTVDLVVATVDGLPFRIDVGGQRPGVLEELIGYDCDPVRVVRTLGDRVWTAGDDGIVRCH